MVSMVGGGGDVTVVAVVVVVGVVGGGTLNRGGEFATRGGGERREVPICLSVRLAVSTDRTPSPPCKADTCWFLAAAVSWVLSLSLVLIGAELLLPVSTSRAKHQSKT